jgi:hypothetical protein
MTTKSKILDRLGERAVLLPELISTALASNDRAKLRLTMLQEALAHGENQGIAPRDLSTERRHARLEDALFDNTIAGARPIGDQLYTIPGSQALLEGLFDDLNTMQAPLANSSPAHELAARMAALREAAPKATGDIVAASEIATLTRARRDGHDSAHLLIMDLHKALNRLTAEIAVETVAGAHVHQILASDRGRVEAFMRGHRTAPLAFGHPGLGTTATRSHNRLVIQNDIGATDAHVLVIHVEENTVTITYTDVHRARAESFISLFIGWNVAFSPLAEDSAGLGKDQAFFLVTGTYQADGEASLDRMLEFLATRIVLLIDWDKARKALRAFVNKRATIEVLQWAAVHDHGHRAFLELGGPELIFESIRHIGGGRVPYGTRLDTVMGASSTIGFLQSVLHIASADAVEDAADPLDDAAFALSLFPEGSVPRNIIEPVMEIAELATGSVADLVRPSRLRHACRRVRAWTPSLHCRRSTPSSMRKNRPTTPIRWRSPRFWRRPARPTSHSSPSSLPARLSRRRTTSRAQRCACVSGSSRNYVGSKMRDMPGHNDEKPKQYISCCGHHCAKPNERPQPIGCSEAAPGSNDKQELPS